MNQRFIDLSWLLLEYKYIYYILDGNHRDSITDSEYDVLEREYKELGGIPYVGFPDTPSSRLVAEKMKQKGSRVLHGNKVYYPTL